MKVLGLVGSQRKLGNTEVLVKEALMGAAGCRELTGLDLRTPEGYQALRDSGLHDTVCTKAVELAERLNVFVLRQADGCRDSSHSQSLHHNPYFGNRSYAVLEFQL